MTITVGIIIIVICVIMEGFFSGSEIAIISIDKLKLKESANQGKHSSKLILKMLEKPEKMLGTTLVGTNISTIVSTTTSAAIFYKLMGPAGIPVSVVVIAIINWIFAEIVPKSIFQQLSDTITPKIIYILGFFYLLFYPVVTIFSAIALLLSKIFGGKNGNTSLTFVTKDELQLLMNMKNYTGDVKPSEKRMISNVLDFNEIEVKEIMCPLIKVAGIRSKANIGEAVNIIKQTKHRRLPVYHDRVDKIIGILNSFDVMDENSEKKIKPLIRPAYFVPPQMNASDLLEKLQKNGINMAIVVDEFGGAEGIVTIEDILEEVVGEIEDEYDTHNKPDFVKNSNSSIINARMEIDEFNQKFQMEIPDGDYVTLGGYFLNHFQRIPKIGESIKLNSSRLTVKKATNKTILEIELKTIKL